MLAAPLPGALDGQIAVVSGASSGIGFAMARAYARLGATVVTVSRAEGDGADAAARINDEVGRDAVRFEPADLSSVEDARRVGRVIASRHPRVHLLANNAGAFFSERSVSDDGLEMTFALNHLGAFVLTAELLPSLAAAGREGSPARVITTSSAAAKMGHVHWDDPMLERDYGGWKAYAQSKLANLLFTFELGRRLRDVPVVAHAFHPGFVRSRFGDGSGLVNRLFGVAKTLFGRPPERGARTGVRLGCDPVAAGESGGYWIDDRTASPPREADDPQAQARLWQLSIDLAGYEADPCARLATASQEAA